LQLNSPSEDFCKFREKDVITRDTRSVSSVVRSACLHSYILL